MLRVSLVVLGLFFLASCSSTQIRPKSASSLPEGFVYLNDVDPSIIQEMRYVGNHNFMGRSIDGYKAPKCILTKQAAEGLAAVQTELKEYSMSLKVYDCYRPQKAVDSFVLWAQDLDDNKMKKEFYPNVDKSNLLRDRYIAEISGHSRGSTADLTIVALPVAKQGEYREGGRLVNCFLPIGNRFDDNSLDFGTGFDCFDPVANTANPTITSEQKQRRMMLKSIMEKNGFKNLPEEWWHFTFRNEPFPSTYFEFPVE